MTDWWQSFFDADYLRLWEGIEVAGKTDREADGLFGLLKLHEGSAVLDAPCGYGRISRALAQRGVTVVGIDFSADLIAEAERRRGDLSVERLRYHRADLRTALKVSGFDAALNIFSSLGYGTESDDLAILSNLRAAVRPGGFVFVETAHRDGFAMAIARTQKLASRSADGTILLEEPRLDPLSGRIEATWYWSGPGGSGQKSSSLRIYTVTELVRLLVAAGLKVCSLHAGCSAEPYVASGPATSWRLGILAVRE
jgi:SAM-dependent methyltransferase